MNKVSRVFLSIISYVIILVSLVMMVVYGRLILSGDFLIYDRPFNGFTRYFLRFVLSLLYLGIGLIEVVPQFRINKFIKSNLYFVEVLLLIASILIYIFATNYIGITVFGLMCLFHLFKGLNMLSNKGGKNESI